MPAGGKALIIGQVKYLRTFDIDLHVIHARDNGIARMEKFNLQISKEVGDTSRITVQEVWVEDVLGYTAPIEDKPYRGFQETEG